MQSARGSSSSRPRAARWGLGWLVVFTVAFVLAASTALRVRTWPGAPHFLAVFLWQLVIWLPWAPVTVLILDLADRWRRVSRSWFAIPLHAAISLALAVGHAALFISYSSYFSPFLGLANTKYGAYPFFFLFWFQLDLLLYWALLGLAILRSSAAELRERERRSQELELRVAESQLQALKMQIQPHFLFNTLNTVVAMQRVGEIDRATRMTVALSELLRRLLASGDAHEVTLDRELELLDRYLEIERYRFEDRLAVERSVEGGLGAAAVPTLLLQPLVENAIRHGMASPAGCREVRVGVERAGERLAIEVTNPAGTAPDAAAGLGIGLENIRRRLDELYGAEYRLSTESESGEFRVQVELPLRWSPGSVA